ncbi:dihydrofolate reductase family protein [Bacillus sp. JCM 19034]|uniref:dihydrofolate reductase family protein n=1 Tax=Bacillus sp. JCM 19034 TaxID=1481928 RepID=UPI000782D991|nr:dihydrofolate reductase family protein [Bacillus sp. JCM 19034]
MTERKVIYSQMVSLDGYIEGPNQDIEWGKPGEELFQHFNDQDNNIDTHIYGRRTYENMRDYWSKRADNPEASKEEVEFSEVWNNIEKVVFLLQLKM